MALFANVGLPMICVYWPSAWIALVPIVFIEAWVGTRFLRTSFGSVLKATFLANLVSTMVGIPVTWVVLALIQLLIFGKVEWLQTIPPKLYAVTIQSAWLNPYEQDLNWMIPAAAVALSIPFYLMSVLTEGPIAKWFLPVNSRQRILRWMCWGNAASYLFLCLLVLVLCSVDGSVPWLIASFTPLMGIAILTLLIMGRFLFSDPVNARNFESIKVGMNARQIELILGQADEHVGTLEGRRIIGGHWGKSGTERSWLRSEKQICVYFDDKETVVGAAMLYTVDVGFEESLREVIHRWFAAH